MLPVRTVEHPNHFEGLIEGQNIAERIATPHQVNRPCNHHRPDDSVGMVMRDLRRFHRLPNHLLLRIERIGDRADPHRRAITETVIRLGIGRIEPQGERRPVCTHRIRVFPAPAQDARPIVLSAQYRIGYRHRANRVVGKAALRGKQREISIPRIVELESRAYYVTNYRTYHIKNF